MALTEMENFTCESLSTNSVTTSYRMLKGEDAIDGYISASFCLLFIMFGIPWNVLVLVTVVKEKIYKQPSILLLLNLILTDIAFLVIPVPLLVVTGLAGEYIGETLTGYSESHHRRVSPANEIKPEKAVANPCKCL